MLFRSVSTCVNVYVCLSAPRWTGDLSRLYPAFCSMTAGIGSSSPQKDKRLRSCVCVYVCLYFFVRVSTSWSTAIFAIQGHETMVSSGAVESGGISGSTTGTLLIALVSRLG